MTAGELKEWLKGEDSTSAGWSKDYSSGETIGHERWVQLLGNSIVGVDGSPSGGKIVHILEKNPDKDSSKYEQDDIDHMRRVVSYCKRHLAQEGKAKQDANSKSYK